ncbi:MAG: KH domain-containing protein [Pseudomonadota bacterium]
MMVVANERALEFLRGLLGRMGVEADVLVCEEDDRVVLEVRGPDAGLIIGKKGQTLDALQFLVSKIAYRGGGDGGGGGGGVSGDGGSDRDRDPALDEKPVVVDIEGYRARRTDSLIELAHRLSEKAIRTRRVIAVNALSPRDRRIIHVALDEKAGVITRSEGEGAARRLLIIPERDKY